MSRFKSIYLIILISVFTITITSCSSKKYKLTIKDSSVEIYAKAYKYYLKGDLQKGMDQIDILLSNYPLSAEAIEAEILLADLNYLAGNYEDALLYYTNFSTLHPAHKKADYAFFQKGMCYLKGILSTDRDNSVTRKALFAFEDFVKYYPESIYTDRAKEIKVFLIKEIAAKEVNIGSFYYKKNNYKGSLTRFKEVLRKYPDSGLSDISLYYIGLSYEKLDENELARESYEVLIQSFPNSKYYGKAKHKLKELSLNI